MGGSLEPKYQSLIDEIKSIASFNDAQTAQNDILQQSQDNFETSENIVVEQLKQIKKQKKEYQRKIKNQLQSLVDISLTIPSSGFTGKTDNSKISNAKKEFLTSINQVVSKIPTILLEEVIHEVGCSQEQTYNANTLNTPPISYIYIPVESVDLFGSLKNTPNSDLGKIFYETGSTTNVQFNGKNTTNKQLYEIIQSPSIPYSQLFGSPYLGFSKQNLFDIEYTTQDNLGNTGNFFKVALLNRNNFNLTSEFITDYYKTIQIIDTQNLVGQIFDILCGVLSIQASLSKEQIEVKTKFQLLIERVLGLCFDEKREIDVSGISKISPTNDIDETFFEFTEMDLRSINSVIDNVKSGVVEFEDCNNVKLPVNNENLINSILKSLQIDQSDSDQLTEVINNVENTLISNLETQSVLSGINFEDVLNTEILSTIPKAIYNSILTPKVLLPFYLMILSANSNLTNNIYQVTDSVSFFKKFTKFNIQVLSRISALFIEILRNFIIKQLRILLRKVIKELTKNAVQKRYLVVAQLVETALRVNKLLTDYRKCEAVLDDIIGLIELALTRVRVDIPQNLIPLAKLRGGFSDIRAVLNVTKEFQRLGIPTGPMPSGAPNLGMLAEKLRIIGVESERLQNSKVLIKTDVGVSPSGPVLPMNGIGIQI